MGFHVFHLVVQFGQHVYEFLLICIVPLVKLQNSLLQNVKNRVEAVVIGFFLDAGGEA